MEGESRSWCQTQLGAVESELSGKWCQVSGQSCKRVQSSRDTECAAVTTDMIFTLTGLDKVGKQALGLSDISRTKDPAKQTEQQKLPSRKRSGGRGVPEDWNPNEQSAQKDSGEISCVVQNKHGLAPSPGTPGTEAKSPPRSQL